MQELYCFKEMYTIIYGKPHRSTKVHVETHKKLCTQQKRGNLGSRGSNFLPVKERCDRGSQWFSASKRVVLATAVCFYVLAGKDRDDECVRGRTAAGDRLGEFSQIFGKTDLCFL